tara:strand:- start:3670 stop:4119 length:450 start_codon:yes stop_codon:yes gene_type:complete
VSNYIHPITLEAALHVASNLRPDDRREVEEGHGVDPIEYLTLEAHNDSCVYFTVPNGKTAGMAGVEDDGIVWMLCTPAIEEYPHTFAKEAKRFIERQDKKLLWNVVDKRNKVHLKLLKFLGFKFLREINYGPNNLPFIEFCYVYRERCV